MLEGFMFCAGAILFLFALPFIVMIVMFALMVIVSPISLPLYWLSERETREYNRRHKVK